MTPLPLLAAAAAAATHIEAYKRRITERTPDIIAAFDEAQEDRPMIEPISNNWSEV